MQPRFVTLTERDRQRAVKHLSGILAAYAHPDSDDTSRADGSAAAA